MGSLDLSYLWGDPGLLLLEGYYYTVLLTFWSGLLAILIGMMAGIVSWLEVPLVTPLIRGYVDFIRNTPFVVQLLFFYFAVPIVLPPSLILMAQSIGFELIVSILALGLYHATFFCEVLRSGLRSVARGQMDGSRALGLSVPFAMRRILLPQAIRVAMPALINETISLAKNTSIAVAIGVTELTYQYRYIGNFDFRGVEALSLATVMYIILCLSISGIGLILTRTLFPERNPR